jgi:hypothetical protein
VRGDACSCSSHHDHAVSSQGALHGA